MDLQREINNLDCVTAQMALKKLGGEGRGEYYFLYSFIDHVKRIQSTKKEAALFKAKPIQEEKTR